MRTHRSVFVALTLTLALATPGGVLGQVGEAYDVVIRGGRVVDPETGFDAVADVGIRGGRIAAVSTDALVGDRKRFLDAGKSDHISKPLEPSVLRRLLDQWLPVSLILSSSQSVTHFCMHSYQGRSIRDHAARRFQRARRYTIMSVRPAIPRDRDRRSRNPPKAVPVH